MTHTLVYPMNTVHNAAGHLEIDGCDILDLVAEHGTPLMVYEEKTLRDQCRRYVSAFASRTDDFEIIYASKAFNTIAMFQLVAEEGLSLDVAGGGEHHTAVAAGFPPERIFYHGNNKTPKELAYALDKGVGYIVLDSLDELSLLRGLAAERGIVQKTLIRVNPGVEAHTHSFIQTGQLDSKFGFSLIGGRAAEAVRLAMQAPELELMGLHAHIGSQIFDLIGFRKEIQVLVDFAREMKDSVGFDCRYLDVGGGLGIRYTEADTPAAVDDYVELVYRGVLEETRRVGLPMPRVLIEPGRSMVGKAGVTAYRVGTVKEVPGIRTYVSVDGGMSDNLRPMLYGAEYEAIIANRVNDVPETVVHVCGKHCESSDILVKDAVLANPQVGDILVMPATGAYCFAMSSNYNGNPRMAVLLVKDGQARTIVERESYEDMVVKQRPLHG
jgi:diaminopimelate decarboxylase